MTRAIVLILAIAVAALLVGVYRTPSPMVSW